MWYLSATRLKKLAGFLALAGLLVAGIATLALAPDSTVAVPHAAAQQAAPCDHPDHAGDLQCCGPAQCTTMHGALSAAAPPGVPSPRRVIPQLPSAVLDGVVTGPAAPPPR